MAPEIITNKNGKNPYDERIDLWSLGITCIELAEKEPPLSEVHPMRALMQIPLRDSPTLQNNKKWSKEFVDFVRECLIKDQTKRHTAEEMLHHTFISGLSDNKNVITSLLEQVKMAKKKVAELESSMEKKDEISEISEILSSESISIPSSPIVGSKSKNKKSDHNSSVLINTPNTRRNTTRATLKQPSVTRREMEIKQAKIMNKVLMMQQLKELSNQREAHLKEIEKLLKSHKKEADSLETEYKITQSKSRDFFYSKEKIQSEKQISEMENLIRKQKNENKDFSLSKIKENTKSLKEFQKKIKSDVSEFKEVQFNSKKDSISQFKEEQKKKNSMSKELSKKEKNENKILDMNEIKNYKINLNQLVEQALLKKINNQNKEILNLKNEQSLNSLLQTQNKILEQLKDTWDLKDKQINEHHEITNSYNLENQEIEINFMKKRTFLQQTHLEKEQALISLQLEKQQTVEKQQQIKSLKSDQKSALKDWNRQKAQRNKNFLKTLKETTKSKQATMKKEDLKSLTKSLQEDYHLQTKNLDLDFTSKQEKEKLDEETLLQQHHTIQRDSLIVDQKNEMETMINEHFKAIKSLEETLKSNLISYAIKNFDEKLIALKQRQNEELRLQTTNSTQLITLIKTQIFDRNSLHQFQSEELMALLEKQKRPDSEIKLLSNELKEEKKIIEKINKQELKLHKKNVKNVMASLKLQHNEQIKNMFDNAPPDYTISQNQISNSNTHLTTSENENSKTFINLSQSQSGSINGPKKSVKEKHKRVTGKNKNRSSLMLHTIDESSSNSYNVAPIQIESFKKNNRRMSNIENIKVSKKKKNIRNITDIELKSPSDPNIHGHD